MIWRIKISNQLCFIGGNTRDNLQAFQGVLVEEWCKISIIKVGLRTSLPFLLETSFKTVWKPIVPKDVLPWCLFYLIMDGILDMHMKDARQSENKSHVKQTKFSSTDM